MKDNKLTRKILIGLSAIGPGLFLIGYNIGTGSVTTMAKVGAEHRMNLTWTLVLVVALYFLLWKGIYRTFEKVLTFFVILMAFSFMAVFYHGQTNYSGNNKWSYSE